ncbi:hypothetical protein N9520_02000 [Amylibacter sp.]|nr:hypothetical protein [Amylibacter sp.]
MNKIKNTITAIALSFSATTLFAGDLTLNSEETKPYAEKCAQQVVWVIGSKKNNRMIANFRIYDKDSDYDLLLLRISVEEVENLTYNSTNAVVDTDTSTVKVRVETFGDYTKKGNGWVDDKIFPVTQGMFECTYENAVKGLKPGKPDYVASMRTHDKKISGYYTFIHTKQQCIHRSDDSAFASLECGKDLNTGAFPYINFSFDTDYPSPYRHYKEKSIFEQLNEFRSKRGD